MYDREVDTLIMSYLRSLALEINYHHNIGINNNNVCVDDIPPDIVLRIIKKVVQYFPL